MKKIFENIFSYKKANKEQFFKSIFKSSENDWILQNKAYLRAFHILISSMSAKHIEFFSRSHPLIFLKSDGRFASSVHQLAKHHLVLIYPETLKSLDSYNFEKALAILAHELGHIYFEHGKKNIDSLEAQIEADRFACQLGFASFLSEILTENAHLEECRIRLSYVTSYEISKTGNRSSGKLDSIA